MHGNLSTYYVSYLFDNNDQILFLKEKKLKIIATNKIKLSS
jgi:hypothetical protein